MNSNDIDVEVINYNIEQVEKILEQIFDEYKNDSFENLQCVAYVYKNSVRFVPVQLKKSIDTLFTWIDRMKVSKCKVLTKK